jgi:NAD(P)-dependent dehydrogenase (short-subunit alcohol dehydrogenase family)
LVTLTWGLAKALAPEIQVNAIAPGPILMPKGIKAAERKRAIEKTLLKRAGDPQDIVAAVLFLLEGSDFVTGVVLPVDGGRLLA